MSTQNPVSAAGFTDVLPIVRRYARCAFRHLLPEQREEAVAEAIALAWRSLGRLQSRGGNPVKFRTALARFSVLAVLNGRRVGSPAASSDVTSVVRRRAGLRLVP